MARSKQNLTHTHPDVGGFQSPQHSSPVGSGTLPDLCPVRSGGPDFDTHTHTLCQLFLAPLRWWVLPPVGRCYTDSRKASYSPASCLTHTMSISRTRLGGLVMRSPCLTTAPEEKCVPHPLAWPLPVPAAKPFCAPSCWLFPFLLDGRKTPAP